MQPHAPSTPNPTDPGTGQKFAVTRRGVLRASMATGLAALLNSGFARLGVGTAAAEGTPTPSPSASASTPVPVRHPHLMVTDFDQLRARLAADPQLTHWQKKIADDCVAMRGTAVTATDTTLRLSWEYARRLLSLAITYRLTPRPEDLAEFGRIVDLACKSDWNFVATALATAEYARSMSLSYDWMYDYLTADQRHAMEEAIRTKAMEPTLALYDNHHWWEWPDVENNWSGVCNSSFAIAGLAMREAYPDLAQELLTKARNQLNHYLGEFAPDGGWPEGPNYWRYAITHLVSLIHCLETATGDDLGLLEVPGISQTGDFPVYTNTNQFMSWDYYDTYLTNEIDPCVMYLGDHFHNDVWRWYGRQVPDSQVTAYSLIWGTPGKLTSPLEAGYALDKSFARSQVSTARASWTNPWGLFAGVKGGDNNTNHAHLDLGTIVLDVFGSRWVSSEGYGDPSQPGYFDAVPGGRRWQLYEARAEGQNTMVFGPGMSEDQVQPGWIVVNDQPVRPHAIQTSLVTSGSSTTEAMAVYDLTKANANLASWQRGARLTDHRRRLQVTDEFTLTKPEDSWWFLHTTATIEVAKDGQSATLSQDGKQLLVRLLDAPEGASFLIAHAVELWTSPRPQDNNWTQYTKLTLRLPGITKDRISVEITPLVPGAKVPHPLPVVPLRRWAVTPDKPANVHGIRVDGVPVPAFRKDILTYDVHLPAGTRAPKVTLDTPPGLSYHLRHDLTKGRGVIWIDVWQGPVRKIATYALNIWRAPVPRDLAGTVVSASGFEPASPPANAIDGDLTTRWAAEGDGQWLALDLGKDVTFSSVSLSWLKADAGRVYTYDIQYASADATTWQTALDHAKSATGSAGLVEVPLPKPVTARFVRLIGHGNTDNDWNSLQEIRIPGVTLTPPATTPYVTSVQLTGSAVLIGKSATWSASTTLSNGAKGTLDGLTVEWITLDPSIATVDQNGLVTAVKVGTTRIAVVVTTPDHRLVWATAPLQVTDGTLVLNPTADTYVQDSTPTVNYGKAGDLVVKNGGPGYTREAYLRFPAQAAMKASKVVLGLTVRATGGAADLDIASLPDSWDENTVTWATKPTRGATAGATTNITSTTAVQVSIDVTALCADALAAGSPIDLALFQQTRPIAQNGLVVESRETTTPPTLTITAA